MIPSSFTYKRAGSAEEALDLIAEHGEDAKFLAGGHSLLPLMKLRLAAPEVIIDLGGLRDLSYVTDQGSYVAIGALTRHHDVEHSELLGREVPLLAYAAGQVGDPQIRHRGTIGGSIAHADPASDLPAVLLALDATVVARGADGEREIGIGEFFQGLFETALEPDELLTEIRVPKPASPGVGPGRSRSSPSGRSTGPSSAAPSRTVTSRWSTWAGRRCAPSRPKPLWPAARPPPTRPRTPPKAPALLTTSAPPAPTASTWPVSWSPAPLRRQVQDHDAERPWCVPRRHHGLASMIAAVVFDLDGVLMSIAHPCPSRCRGASRARRARRLTIEACATRL